MQVLYLWFTLLLGRSTRGPCKKKNSEFFPSRFSHLTLPLVALVRGKGPDRDSQRTWLAAAMCSMRLLRWWSKTKKTASPVFLGPSCDRGVGWGTNRRQGISDKGFDSRRVSRCLSWTPETVCMQHEGLEMTG